jgi:hypothetical protein
MVFAQSDGNTPVSQAPVSSSVKLQILAHGSLSVSTLDLELVYLLLSKCAVQSSHRSFELFPAWLNSYIHISLKKFLESDNFFEMKNTILNIEVSGVASIRDVTSGQVLSL